MPRSNMPNPYSPSLTPMGSREDSKGFSMLLIFLVLSALASCFLAFVDAYQQRCPPNENLELTAAFLALGGHVPGVLFSLYIPRTSLPARFVNLCLAIPMSLFSLLAYFLYYLNGAEGSFHGAGQVHIIVFPVSHLLISLFCYAVFSVGLILHHIGSKNSSEHPSHEDRCAAKKER